MSVKMVEGAWYRRLDKKVVGPARKDSRNVRLWVVGGYAYDESGNWLDSGLIVGDLDLVERVNPDGSPYFVLVPEPPQPERTMLLPQVGERWRSRDGSFLTEALTAGPSGNGTLVGVCSDGVTRCWHAGGHYMLDMSSPKDLCWLVEERRPAPTVSIQSIRVGDLVRLPSNIPDVYCDKVFGASPDRKRQAGRIGCVMSIVDALNVGVSLTKNDPVVSWRIGDVKVVSSDDSGCVVSQGSTAPEVAPIKEKINLSMNFSLDGICVEVSPDGKIEHFKFVVSNICNVSDAAAIARLYEYAARRHENLMKLIEATREADCRGA